MTPEWLEYGSLGLLALVLGGLGGGAWRFLSRWLDNQKAALANQAEADKQAAMLEAERQASRDRFLQELVVEDRESRAETLAAVQGLVAKDIEAKQALSKALDGMTGALGELCERQDRHEQRATERHQQMILLCQRKGPPE